MNKLKFFSAFILITMSVLYIGCGDDTTTNNGGNTGGTPPTINMKVGSTYSFTNDSLDTNTSLPPRHTRLKTTYTYITQDTFFGQPNAFEINSVTRDTVANQNLGTETFYVRYEGGIFYQYGLIRLIDSTQSPNWDVVANFNLANGTPWTIGTFSTVIGGFISVTVTVTGKVMTQTSFVTNNTGQTINCYRIEIEGAVVSAGGPLGSIFVDYYIGYSNPATNPAGMVRLTLRPIWLTLPPPVGTTLYRAEGGDSKIDYFVIP